MFSQVTCEILGGRVLREQHQQGPCAVHRMWMVGKKKGNSVRHACFSTTSPLLTFTCFMCSLRPVARSMPVEKNVHEHFLSTVHQVQRFAVDILCGPAVCPCRFAHFPSADNRVYLEGQFWLRLKVLAVAFGRSSERKVCVGCSLRGFKVQRKGTIRSSVLLDRQTKKSAVGIIHYSLFKLWTSH